MQKCNYFLSEQNHQVSENTHRLFIINYTFSYFWRNQSPEKGITFVHTFKAIAINIKKSTTKVKQR